MAKVQKYKKWRSSHKKNRRRYREEVKRVVKRRERGVEG